MNKSRDQNAYFGRLSPFDYRGCWKNNLFDDHLTLRPSLQLARLTLKLLHAGLSHTQVTVPSHTHATGPSHTQATVLPIILLFSHFIKAYSDITC